MKIIKIFTLFAVISLWFVHSANAQNRFDALRYNYTDPGNGPISLSMGGASVANATGFGSFVQNPATSALFNKSFFSFGLSSRNVGENSTYLGNQRKFNDSQTSISNLGGIFKIPTVQGALVFGLGYSQTANFNQAFSVKGFNSSNTITDAFNQEPFYSGIAYDGYALDSTSTGGTAPVLRLAGFKGIEQYAEERERGQMGEYSLFGATEFQKNLYLGLSLNFPVGNYTYKRSFLETDPNNLYSTPPYDVNSIDSEDYISANITGFYARVGFIYKVMPWFNIGASYRTKTNLTVKENYNSSVQTTFKTPDSQGNTSYKGSLNGTDQYKVVNPGRVTLGASVANYKGLTINFSTEYVPYSQIQMQGLTTQIRETQNSAISSQFKNVWNINVGAAYHIGYIEPRIGYAYYPSPRKSFNASRTYYSAGIGLGVGTNFIINVGVQYATWKDNITLYSINYTNTTVNQVANQNIHKINAMIGLQLMF